MQKYFFIKVDGKYIRIHFQEILYVEGCKNYLKIITAGRSFLILLSMKRMEQLLPSTMFVRIHKSYIVSLEHITQFDRETVYLKEKILPVGYQFRGAIERSVLIAQEEQQDSLLRIPISYIGQKAYAG